MTVGAALVVDRFGADDPTLASYFERLTSDDPREYVEGAMFLTEKQGGSDVGANETTAVATDEPGVYQLTGEKWFCSNIDAEGTLVLARREDAPAGTAGLSLFLVPHTLPEGSAGVPPGSGGEHDQPRIGGSEHGGARLNDQRYRRLKDKLGTKSVPTGEVELTGAVGYLVGEPENGFRQMTEMLNFERLSNAAASLGIMGRCLLESKVHAANREAFGDTIDQYPLMRRDLAEMSVRYEAASAFVFAASRLLDDYRTADEGRESDAYRLLRLLVPIAKLRTARDVVETASYACEVLGGNGYVSGFTTERMLRDAQVLPIWEGTSNVLSLDVLRVLDREAAHEVFVPAVEERLESATHPALSGAVETVRREFEELQGAMATLAGEDREYAQLQAKELANYTYDVFAAAELLAMAQRDVEEREDARRVLVAREFVADRFGRREARGIGDGDRRATESFDALVRYANVDPESLVESATDDD
jgi:alkylation response protein AidB-like acyl-CoA dehydrogenase